MVDQQVTTPNQLEIQKAQYAAIIKNLNRALRADFSDDSNAEIFAGLRSLENFFRYHDIAVEDERIAANYLMLQNPHLSTQKARVVEDFLDIWDEKYHNVTLEMLASAGLEIVKAGRLVPPDPNAAKIQTGSGAGWKAPRIVDKRGPLLVALRNIGIGLADLKFYEGKPPPPGSIRTEPYDVIEIKKLDVQIAFCKQIGAVTMVKRRPWLTPEQWESAPDVLQNELGIEETFNYDEQGHWLKRLCDYITTDQQTPPIEENAPSPAPKAVKKRDSTPMTLELITEWLWLSIEHDIAHGGMGQAANAGSGDIWIKDEQGNWIKEGRKWATADQWLENHEPTCLGLAQLKEKLGIYGKMSLAEVQRCLLLSVKYERQGRAPNHQSGSIMQLDKQGNWIEKKPKWMDVNNWARTYKNSSVPGLKEQMLSDGLLLEIGQNGKTKYYKLTELGQEYLDLQDTTGRLTVELFLAERASKEPMTAESPALSAVDSILTRDWQQTMR
jgi:hypothetical protein